METTMTGAEWNKFYNDPNFWGHGQWHDESTMLVDGVETDDYDEVPDSATVTVSGGYVITDLDASRPTEDSPTLDEYYHQWQVAVKKAAASETPRAILKRLTDQLEKLTTDKKTFIILECPNDKQPQLIAAVQQAGGKLHLSKKILKDSSKNSKKRTVL